MKEFAGEKAIRINEISFRYDPHSLKKTLDNITFEIPEERLRLLLEQAEVEKPRLLN